MLETVIMFYLILSDLPSQGVGGYPAHTHILARNLGIEPSKFLESFSVGSTPKIPNQLLKPQ